MNKYETLINSVKKQMTHRCVRSFLVNLDMNESIEKCASEASLITPNPIN